MLTPIFCDCDISVKFTLLPNKVISPASLVWIPVSTFISVDLPAPFSPMSACTSPALRSKLTDFKACTPEKYLSMFFISKMVWDIFNTPFFYSLSYLTNAVYTIILLKTIFKNAQYIQQYLLKSIKSLTIKG